MDTSTIGINSLDKNIMPITAKINSQGALEIGGCNTIELAQEYGTPLYIIDEATLQENCFNYIKSLRSYFKDFLVLYASKAFCSTAILNLVNNYGMGIDVVSGGELYAALKAKVNNENIYFHGNNKSYDEIEFAIKSNIGKFVCDNFHELNLIDVISQKLNKKVKVLIRFTPGIECHTHEYIKTGHLDSKFGFDLEYFDQVIADIKSKPNITLVGLHGHIGSQIFEIKPYLDLLEIYMEKIYKLKNEHQLEIKELNIGGGIGISYTNTDDPFTIDDWAQAISKKLNELTQKYNLNTPKIICEPGRSIVGPSGVTLYTVGNVKNIPEVRKYIAVDGGMADNPRPITYQAKYSCLIANKAQQKDTEVVTIAGRYCESGDILIKDISLPPITTGDILAVFSTGAYNYSMSSNYNMVPKPACILVKNGKSNLIIKRETYSDVIKKHIIPQENHS